MKQSSLPFNLDHDLQFANYYKASTAHLLIINKLTEAKQQKKFNHILVAKPGDGKSHILQACIQATSQAALLACKHIDSLQPDILHNLEQHSLFIDDIDLLLGHNEWEQSLFRLLTINPHIPILATTSQAIQHCPFTLPDLASRLQALCPLYIPSLDEKQQTLALQYRARKRGIYLHTSTCEWLQKLIPRDNHTLFALLDKIDDHCLNTQSKPSISVLKKILQQESFIV